MIVSSFISSFVKQIPKMITSMAVQTTNKYFICGWKISGIGLTSSTAKIDSKNDSSKCFSKSLWFEKDHMICFIAYGKIEWLLHQKIHLSSLNTSAPQGNVAVKFLTNSSSVTV